MSILRVASALNESCVARALVALADSFDFGLFGELLESKVPQNVRFFSKDVDETPCKI